jgi:hypothetical protein
MVWYAFEYIGLSCATGPLSLSPTCPQLFILYGIILGLRLPLVWLLLSTPLLGKEEVFHQHKALVYGIAPPDRFLQLPELRLVPNLLEQREDHSFERGLTLS